MCVLKWIGPLKDLYFFKNYLFHSYIHVCFLLVAFVREYMWHKAIWMGFESNWVPHSYGLVPHVFWQKQQTGNIHVCKNKINNS